MQRSRTKPTCADRSVVSLFSGVGGIELGLSRHGFAASMFCEASPEARRVLENRFPGVPIHHDIRDLVKTSDLVLPRSWLVSAGFPCQDLSQCGRTRGIRGRNSGLVDCVFELLARTHESPEWLLIENVPFMLRLDHGRAMRHVTRSLEALGFRWAYRVVDARAFGLPQRRERVILLASRRHYPERVLFGASAQPALPSPSQDDRPRGFYWTEGNTGLGWAVDSVPTLKAGSTIGIPSPPGIWLPAFHTVVTPTIEDAESFQGLPRGWTRAAGGLGTASRRARWRLVGNAVPVPISEWVGRQLVDPPDTVAGKIDRSRLRNPWPTAAFGAEGTRYAVDVSTWPCRRPWRGLAARFGPKGEFLRSRTPLSSRAARGFHGRLARSPLRVDPRFLASLECFIGGLGRRRER